jgi:hypothetical protein
METGDSWSSGAARRNACLPISFPPFPSSLVATGLTTVIPKPWRSGRLRQTEGRRKENGRKEYRIPRPFIFFSSIFFSPIFLSSCFCQLSGNRHLVISCYQVSTAIIATRQSSCCFWPEMLHAARRKCLCPVGLRRWLVADAAHTHPLDRAAVFWASPYAERSWGNRPGAAVGSCQRTNSKIFPFALEILVGKRVRKIANHAIVSHHLHDVDSTLD